LPFTGNCLGAVTVWGEYHAGSTAAATAVKTNTILAEIDYALNKQFSLAARYTTYDPNINVSNDGRSAIQAGLEYMVNDAVTYGLEYTVRSNEGTDVADDTSITATSQFKF
jgi:opacity protein-like surface antigen